MDYEWDEAKRISNLEKHELDFYDLDNFEWSAATNVLSVRHGEERWLAFGYMGERLHCVVYTIRGERRRIVSFRRANRSEERKYVQA